jgi:hypothetical protein
MHVAVEAEFVLECSVENSMLGCIETSWVRSALGHTLQFWCRGAIPHAPQGVHGIHLHPSEY